MKKITTAILIIATFCVALVSGCTLAAASEQTVDEKTTAFERVSDKASHELTVKRETEKRARAMDAYISRQSAQEATETSVDDDVEVFTDYGYYESYMPSQSVVQGNQNGLNSFDGTFDYNGKHETYYSTPAVYDADCHVDDEGFWRTDDGHYVVASSDYEPGTEIEISQGKAIVMDDGCESGTVDVHTNW